MSNLTNRAFIALLFLIASIIAKGQTNKLSPNDGIWQDYGGALKASDYPEFHGRLVNVNWSDIEDSPNHWHWGLFDTDVNQHIADSMPVIILVYTGPAAPGWIYSHGVPRVTAYSGGDSVAFSPYYLDTDYNNYFKRMIDSVCRHIQSYPSPTRNLIIGIQGCYGSTGDQIAYKGTVASQYAITSPQFDSLFKVYSSYYYNDYKGLTPPIRLLSNPSPTDSSETIWLMNNCPSGWIKCGTFAKGSQVNMEADKQSWLYNILNQPQNGQFVMARSEITGPQLTSGKWINNHYKEMFGIMCYDIYWGLDWPNETADIIKNHNYDSTFAFFNKYAGQKIPGLATNAMCALKDVLDASDSVRFPSGSYGAVSQTNVARYQKICGTYTKYGARLEDTSAAIINDLGSISSQGINDVGWHLLSGNYERYLHQINANATSAGYWNINTADTTCMYGRYARGFDVANNKNALYFDVEDDFLRNAPLNGKYPVTIDITYLDSGNGSWALYYDSMGTGNANKFAMQVNCIGSNKWIKASVTLKKAYFGNRATNKSDFYIQNKGTSNVIFSVVELSRAQQPDTTFLTTPLDSFGTVGVNTTVPPHTFVAHASSYVLKYGSKVQIGPLKNCSFSTSANGNFTDTLFINYNADSTINQTVYVTVKTNDTTIASGDSAIISGGIPVSCGNKKALVKVSATVANSSPVLTANITNASYYGKKDGAIDLHITKGMDSATFTYKWTKETSTSWSTTTQDISGLAPDNYTVVVSSDYGCTTSAKYTVTQPQQLVITVTQDSAAKCKADSATVTVTATGGTTPYTGIGTSKQKAGTTKLYTVKDAYNDSISVKFTTDSGAPPPDTPVGINGLANVYPNQQGLKYSVINSDITYGYKWNVSGGNVATSGDLSGTTSGDTTIAVNWGKNPVKVSVSAHSSCGYSTPYVLPVSINNSLRGNADFNTSDAKANNLSTDNAITLLPNPVRDIATIKFFTPASKAYAIMISDINGKPLLTRKNTSLPGNNIERLDVSNYAAGMYLITVIEQGGERRATQMIKQ